MALSSNEEEVIREATIHAVTLRQDGAVVKFHDYDIVQDLMDLHRVMEKVVATKARLFRLEKGVVPLAFMNAWHEGMITPTKAGKDLVKHLSNNIDALHDEFPGRKFHPLIELFGRYASEMFLCWNTPTKAACDRLNKLVHAMRAEAHTKAFRNKRDAHLRSSRDATKALCAKVDELFRRVSRTNVVSLMLSYHIDETTFTQMSSKEVWNRVSEQQARAHRDAFIKHVRRMYRSAFQTFAWKEELGRFTSYHYHVLLFFDARQVQSGYFAGHQLCRYWDNVITAGKGRSHNCNADSYPEHGLGIINYYDKDKIKALKERVIPYLTKSDYYIRLVTNGRIFQTGGLPAKPKRGCGRPRKYPPHAFHGAPVSSSVDMPASRYYVPYPSSYRMAFNQYSAPQKMHYEVGRPLRGLLPFPRKPDEPGSGSFQL